MTSLAFVLPYTSPAVTFGARLFVQFPDRIKKAVFWDNPFAVDLPPPVMLIECEQRLLDEASIGVEPSIYRARDRNAIARLLAAHIALCEITR